MYCIRKIHFTHTHTHKLLYMLYSSERKGQCVYLLSTFLSVRNKNLSLLGLKEWFRVLLDPGTQVRKREPLCSTQGLPLLSLPSSADTEVNGCNICLQGSNEGPPYGQQSCKYKGMSLPHSDKVDWQHVQTCNLPHLRVFLPHMSQQKFWGPISLIDCATVCIHPHLN